MTSDIRIAPDVCLFLLEDEGVFFAESRQELHLFNTPAAFVWCCLEEGLAPADIVTAYGTAFGWLLTNPSLRADFARSPADTAGPLRVRSADLEAFVTLDPDALEAQAE